MKGSRQPAHLAPLLKSIQGPQPWSVPGSQLHFTKLRILILLSSMLHLIPDRNTEHTHTLQSH